MAKKDYLERYSFIYNKLINQKQSLDDLHGYINKNLDDKIKISKRTIQRDIAEVETFFSITITYNRKEKYYEIDDNNIDDSKRRTIESFELYNALQYSSKIGNKIILENRNRSGIDHIHGLLHAIENNFEVQFTHSSFWNANPPKVPVQFVTVRLQPVTIKEAQHRWYLVGFNVATKQLRSYGLDRISDLKILDQKFKGKNFDPISYFQHAFGIETNGAPEKIVLKFTSKQALYIKALPIHQSQKIVFEDNDYCVFEYLMHPAFALTMEIFKYGASVQVLEPISLVEEVKESLLNALKLYK